MPVYRIPMDNKEAVSRLAGRKVKRWVIHVPSRVVEVEVEEEVEGLEKFKA